MISLIVLVSLALIIAVIILKHALQAVLLIGIVACAFTLGCYAFDADPQVVLGQGVHIAKHEYRTWRHS